VRREEGKDISIAEGALNLRGGGDHELKKKKKKNQLGGGGKRGGERKKQIQTSENGEILTDHRVAY